MKEVRLGRTDYIAVVDDDVYESVREHTWTPQHRGWTTYAVESYGCCGGIGRRMHRVVLAAPSGVRVDHLNGDGLDNRRANLRLASARENGGNRRKQSGSSSFKGVSRQRPTHQWRAQIKDHGRLVTLGTFRDEAEAARAYDEAARRIFGAFAAVNFPLPGERSALHPDDLAA